VREVRRAWARALRSFRRRPVYFAQRIANESYRGRGRDGSSAFRAGRAPLVREEGRRRRLEPRQQPQHLCVGPGGSTRRRAGLCASGVKPGELSLPKCLLNERLSLTSRVRTTEPPHFSHLDD
jgi:hypothetical protein